MNEFLAQLLIYGGYILGSATGVLCFVTYRTTKKEKNYNLIKTTKINGVETKDLPEDVIRKVTINQIEKNIKKIFKPYIYHFMKVIDNMFDENTKRNVYTNLSTLKIVGKKQKGPIKRNFYSPSTNNILLNSDEFLDGSESIYHELLHCVTTRILDDKLVCGLEVENIEKNKIFGKGLNEGYTELLTTRYFSQDGKNRLCYFYEKEISKKLEEIIGKDKMQNYYFNEEDVFSIIKYLFNYIENEKTINFIIILDEITEKNISLKTENELKSDSDIDEVKELYLFLIELKINKYLIDNKIYLEKINQKDKDELKQKIIHMFSGYSIIDINGYKKEILTNKELDDCISRIFLYKSYKLII